MATGDYVSIGQSFTQPIGVWNLLNFVDGSGNFISKEETKMGLYALYVINLKDYTVHEFLPAQVFKNLREAEQHIIFKTAQLQGFQNVSPSDLHPVAHHIGNVPKRED